MRGGAEVAEGCLALCRAKVFQDLLLVGCICELGHDSEEVLGRRARLDVGTPCE